MRTQIKTTALSIFLATAAAHTVAQTLDSSGVSAAAMIASPLDTAFVPPPPARSQLPAWLA